MDHPRQISQQLRQSYGQIAADFSASRSRSWPEFELFLSHIPEDSKILDLGCGNGRLLAYLQEKGRRVDYTGVDFCPELLEIARKRFPRQDFVEQNMAELDLPQSFDVIACVAAFHHLPSVALRKKALKAMYKQLDHRGVLLLSVWNLWQFRYWKAHLKAIWHWVSHGFRWSPRDLFIPFGKEAVPRYYHAFTSRELIKLLQDVPFQIEESRVSGHNLVFICRKKIAVAPGNPLLVKQEAFPEPFAPHHA